MARLRCAPKGVWVMRESTVAAVYSRFYPTKVLEVDAHALELDPRLGWSNTGMRAESRQRSWDLEERRWAINR